MEVLCCLMVCQNCPFAPSVASPGLSVASVFGGAAKKSFCVRGGLMEVLWDFPFCSETSYGSYGGNFLDRYFLI